MSETVQGALGEDGIVEQGDPLVDGAVGGDDGRGASMALDDDLVEVAGLLGIEAPQSEIIDDQEVWCQQAAQDPFGGVVAVGSALDTPR